MIRLCFVCLGNICRSPTADGIMKELVRQQGLEDKIFVDSAGTSAWHAGEPSDRRSAAKARERGITLDSISRQFTVRDFDDFDYILAMDHSNLSNMSRLARGEDDLAKLSLFRDHDPSGAAGLDVPDPYYGGGKGFDVVFDICWAASEGLLAKIRAKHEL